MNGPKVTYWLSEIDESHVSFVGGKNANLGRLYRLGMPVPPGFCISVFAFDRFLEMTGIGKQILDRLSDIRPENVNEIQEASKEVRKKVEEADIPEDLRQALLAAYREFCAREGGNVSVAVRSSGVSEDMASASCAGLFETYLNVQGENSFLVHVKKVWSSAFTDRVLVYKMKKGIRLAEGLGVCVTKMIDAEVAGVVFTANPNNGDTTYAIVEANWGIGESVVGGGAEGTVIPDRWIVRKDDLAIEERILGRKSKAVTLKEDGGTQEKDLDIFRQRQFCLTDEKIREIVRLAVEVEKCYRFPQDIEFAVDQKGLTYLVQTRPVIFSIKKPVEIAIDAILTKFLR